MRRIYESDALHRDDADPHSPRERDGTPKYRSLNWRAASHALLPVALRRWAIDVEIETAKETYAVDEPIDLRVRFRNRLPFPVTLRTRSPVPWHWAVDGHVDARVEPPDEPDDRSAFQFGRSETKTFTRRWPQLFKTGDRTWEPAEPGEHTLSVSVNDGKDASESLRAETVVRIERGAGRS